MFWMLLADKINEYNGGFLWILIMDFVVSYSTKVTAALNDTHTFYPSYTFCFVTLLLLPFLLFDCKI